MRWFQCWFARGRTFDRCARIDREFEVTTTVLDAATAQPLSAESLSRSLRLDELLGSNEPLMGALRGDADAGGADKSLRWFEIRWFEN